MLIIERIKKNYVFLSNKQKKIADYLVEHDDEMGFKTLKAISNAVGVTEVTVINFCKAMGFANFMEMKELYRKELTERFSPSKKIFTSFNENTVHSTLLPTIVEQQIQNHTRTLYRLDEESLAKTIEYLVLAKTVYIFYRGSTEAAAVFFKARLENVAINVEVINTAILDNRFFFNTMRFCKDDLYIFLTYPLYSKVLIKFCEHFKKKDFTVVALTDRFDSPITKYADISFFTDNDSQVFFNSFQSLISIIEIIVILLHNAMKDRLLAYKSAVEQMESEFSQFIQK